MLLGVYYTLSDLADVDDGDLTVTIIPASLSKQSLSIAIIFCPNNNFLVSTKFNVIYQPNGLCNGRVSSEVSAINTFGNGCPLVVSLYEFTQAYFTTSLTL